MAWVLNEVVPPGDPIPGGFKKVHIEHKTAAGTLTVYRQKC